MGSKSEEIREKIPNVEEISRIVKEINGLSMELALSTYELEKLEAIIVRKATLEQNYFQGGKPLSQEFIKNSWKITGFEDELSDKRKENYVLQVKLDNAKRLLRSYELQIEIWRTVSANERQAF